MTFDARNNQSDFFTKNLGLEDLSSASLKAEVPVVSRIGFLIKKKPIPLGSIEEVWEASMDPWWLPSASWSHVRWLAAPQAR